MKQWNELYKVDIESYLKEKFEGERADRLWHQDICCALRELLPQEHREKLTAYVNAGNSLYTDIEYEGVTLFVVGISRTRELKDSPYSYPSKAVFTYKEIRVYFTNDEMSFKDTIDAALVTKKQQSERKTEGLKNAKQVYDFIKEVLQTSSYLEISDFLLFMRNNFSTIEDM